MKKKKLEFYKLFRPIAEDAKLSMTPKLVAMYIFTLHSFGRSCTASNIHISKELNISSSAVDSAIKTLEQYEYLKDIRETSKYRVIEILKPEICEENHYKFHSTVLNSRLTTSAKFLLMYILSYHHRGQKCYASNANILNDIGLCKDSVNDSIKELKRHLIIYILNPGRPERELRIPSGIKPLQKLVEWAIEIEKKEKIDKDAAQNTVSPIPINRNGHPEYSSDNPEYSSFCPEYHPIRPEYRDNNKNNDRMNNSINERNNNRSLNNNNSTSDILTNSIPELSNKIDNTSIITIDDLIKYFSKKNSFKFDDEVSKLFQENNISTKELLTSNLYNQLKQLGNLKEYLNKENKIVLTTVTEGWDEKYVLVSNLNKVTETEISTPPFGYDLRLFSQIEIKENGYSNITGCNPLWKWAEFLVEMKLGLGITINDEYCKEEFKHLDLFQPNSITNSITTPKVKNSSSSSDYWHFSDSIILENDDP